MRKMIKTMIAAVYLGMCMTCPVFAEDASDVIPMSEISVGEDTEGMEDGEILIKENAKKDSTFMNFRYYRAAGVNSNYYGTTLKHGIDVSRHQGQIDWQKVRASGVEFAMIRVGYRGYGGGVIYGDEWFETNIKNAKAAGLKVGIYFFSQALNEAEAREEASYTLNIIKDYEIDYPVVFDWETAKGYRTYDVSFTKAQMNAMASVFCDMVESSGYIPMVYSNKTDFSNRFDYDSLAEKYYIWYARYPYRYGGTTWYQAGQDVPTEFSFNIWQYMSDGTVPGVSGDCDVNITLTDFTVISNPPKPEPVEVQLSSSDSNVVIDAANGQITGLPADSTYLDIANAFDKFYIQVNGTYTNTNTSGGLKTGDKLVFSPKDDNTYLVNTDYTLVIMGDINQDGTINVKDMEKIQKYLLGIDRLTDIQKKAASISVSGDISVLDMEKIQKHILGILKL